jgi:hypothetical protein
MGAHALLSASKASQWINCTPSARLTEHMPDRGSTEAKEGTDAHKLAEIKLRRQLTPCNSTQRQALESELAQLKDGPYYNAEMESVIQAYTEIIEERYMEAKSRSQDAVILLEERIDLTEWVPEAFGSCDVVIISDGVLEVIDLKYGKGVPVSAIGNLQIRLYGLGAWNNYSYLYDVNEIRLTIIQPRRDSISTEVLTAQELREWAESMVRPAAVLAFAGKGEFKSGDHCKWCKARAQCKARADSNLKVTAYEFKDPALLTLDEIGPILFIAKQLSAWAKDVGDYALAQALTGKKVPQWKLVEGKSNRTITDKLKAMDAFKAAGVQSDKYLKPADIRGFTDLEKLVGKKEVAHILGDLIIKPPGKPALAPETDPRPERNSLENDFANIDMEA